MPNRNSKHLTYNKETQWAVGLETVLRELFTPQEIANFKREGVRFRLSVQSPFPRPKAPKKQITLQPERIDALRKAVTDPAKLEKLLNEFSGPELLKLGREYINIKLPNKANLAALRSMVFDAFRSEEVWRKIAGVEPRE